MTCIGINDVAFGMKVDKGCIQIARSWQARMKLRVIGDLMVRVRMKLRVIGDLMVRV